MTESDARTLTQAIRSLVRAVIDEASDHEPDSMGSYYEEKALVEHLVAIFPEPKEST